MGGPSIRVQRWLTFQPSVKHLVEAQLSTRPDFHGDTPGDCCDGNAGETLATMNIPPFSIFLYETPPKLRGDLLPFFRHQRNPRPPQTILTLIQQSCRPQPSFSKWGTWWGFASLRTHLTIGRSEGGRMQWILEWRREGEKREKSVYACMCMCVHVLVCVLPVILPTFGIDAAA